MVYAFKCGPHSSHAKLLAYAGRGLGLRLLDVGSGGVLSRRFAHHGWKVTALDKDPTHEPDVLCDLDRFIGSREMPGLLGTFDLIVCGDVLEHLEAPGAVLTWLATLLQDNGRLLISVPNVAHLWARWTLLLGRWPQDDRGIFDRDHRHFFTRESLRALVHEAGLRIVKESATPAPVGGWPIVRRLHAWLAQSWPTVFGYQFILVTVKLS